MTVKSNDAIAIAMLTDWPKNLTPVFQLMKCKTKSNCTLNMWFYEQVTGILLEFFFWFTVLFAPVVIGQSNFLGMSFWTVYLKATLTLMSSFIAGSPNERLECSVALQESID